MRRVVVAVIALVLLAGIGSAVWMLLGWPPPQYILRYGLTPGCEPAGRTKTVEGVTFVEIGPGCFRMGSMYGGGNCVYKTIIEAEGGTAPSQP